MSTWIQWTMDVGLVWSSLTSWSTVSFLIEKIIKRELNKKKVNHQKVKGIRELFSSVEQSLSLCR